MQHFGKLVSEVITRLNKDLEDVATAASISLEKLNMMLNRDEWTTQEVKLFSVALQHDLGKYLSPWEISINAKVGYQEATYYVVYHAASDGDKLDQLTALFNRKVGELGLVSQ